MISGLRIGQKPQVFGGKPEVGSHDAKSIEGMI